MHLTFIRVGCSLVALPGHIKESQQFKQQLLIKLLRIMRLTILFLIGGLLQVSAKSAGQVVSLSVKDLPIEQVFEKIEQQTNYIFVYFKKDLEKIEPINLQLSKVPLKAALNNFFAALPLVYTIEDKYIVVKPLVREVFDSQLALLPIKGVIKTADGQPLAGASITVKGTGVTAISDEKGNFEINANEGQVLVISYVGFERQEVRVGKAGGELNIVLTARAISIDSVQVISTGYQRISRERFVGSAVTLDSAAYNRRAGVSILERLDGTVAGIFFNKKDPGATSPIQIRGISTLGLPQLSPTTAPLIILDNFPYSGNINSINQNDVESISILKDAAAASIWGAQAGNGVIVITTKKGRYNRPLSVSIASNVTITEKPDLYYAPQMSISDYIGTEEFLFNKGAYNTFLNFDWFYHFPFSPVLETFIKRKAGQISAVDSAAQIDIWKQQDLRNDLNKYVYKNALAQQHHINFNGGSNKSNYQLSLGFNNAMPNIKGSEGISQYTINSNAAFRLTRRMELQIGINYNQTIDKEYVFNLPTSLYPYAQLANENGVSLAVPNGYRMPYVDTTGGGKLLDWYYRPLDEIALADNKSINRFARFNIGIQHSLTNWLSAEVKYQYINEFNDKRNYYSLETYRTRDLINLYTNLSQTTATLRNPVPMGAILDVGNSYFNRHNIRGQLNFNRGWHGKHVLNGLVAGELSTVDGGIENNRFYGYSDERGNYQTNIDYITTYPIYTDYRGLIKRTVPVGSSYSSVIATNLVSVLANASYTYDNRYSIYASARRDGTNFFGVNTNNRWKPLWSVGLSWDASKERFYTLEWMPNLKIRASYGYTGNVNNYSLSGLTTIRYGGAAYLTNLPTAQSVNPPNPNLRWEQVRTVNMGLDFSLFKNRITGSFDFFNKKSTDLISPLPFAPATGVDLYTVNAATLQGNGYELQLQSKNNIGVIQWQIAFGLSYVKMIVKKLYDGGYKASDFILYRMNPAVGKVAFGISSYRWAGLDPLNGDPQGYLNGHISKNYLDIANDSIQNQVFHGSSVPLYSGFINNAFNWNGFTLSANVTYRLAYYFRKPTISYSNLFNTASIQGHPDYNLRWQKVGDEHHTTVPSLLYPVNNARDNFYTYSEVNVLKGDNVRLQDVRVQYDFNQNIIRKLPFKGVQVYLYANNLNLILWRANSSNLDPDFTGGTSAIYLPTARTWTGGINLNF